MVSFIIESLLWLDTSYVLACQEFRPADSDAKPMYLGQDGVGGSGPDKRVNYVTAVRQNYTAVEAFSAKRLWTTFRQAIWALLTPVDHSGRHPRRRLHAG
ncbi:hypothetical protein [Caballeronia sp. LjRoot31]|jgi:hypothetical protein|uniref:hypothetical protein n=1 Tax=Caballeronia sp. LjRoot31 TaxID=3342324 RepID=UPI003ED0E7F2